MMVLAGIVLAAASVLAVGSRGIRAAHRRQDTPTIYVVLTNFFVGCILERCWTSP
jgi:hypothetical protein